MQTYLSHGIILQTLNFKEYDQIVTVFTENEGVMKFFAKRGNVDKNKLKCVPLTRAEFVYTIGRSELYPICEISPKEHYLQLRQNLKNLDSACTCLKAILKTQMLHKPAPFLYKLLTAYLGKIPTFSNDLALEASFHLKILQHEGVLDLGSDFGADSGSGSYFSEDELYLATLLTAENSFSNLEKMEVTEEFNNKVKYLFQSSTE